VHAASDLMSLFSASELLVSISLMASTGCLCCFARWLLGLFKDFTYKIHFRFIILMKPLLSKVAVT
jgi:hypothetical protein